VKARRAGQTKLPGQSGREVGESSRQGEGDQQALGEGVAWGFVLAIELFIIQFNMVHLRIKLY